MRRETWQELNSQYALLLFFPEDKTILQNMLQHELKKGLDFINFLLANGIALSRIEINDWNCSNPKIWVDGWQYWRKSNYDMKRALRRARENDYEKENSLS